MSGLGHSDQRGFKEKIAYHFFLRGGEGMQ